MELEVIFENEFSSARYDREKGVLWASYKGIVRLESSIESFQNVLDVLDKYPIRGAVYNMMEMKGTFSNLNQWLKDVWYPALLPQGYICWAMATTDVFTRFAGSMLINKMTPKEVTAHICRSLEKAEKWTYDFLEKADR